jgi:sugar-phosphatase
VLVDSTSAGERAWRRWAREYRLVPARVVDGVHGRRSRETVALFVRAEQQPAALERIEQIEVDGAAGTRPIPGARELLDSLPGNWAVVTSASPALARARLAAAGLAVPPVVVTGDDVRVGKPAPEGYLVAAARLGLDIAECTVFEDSGAGVAAGLAAGAGHVIGVGARALTTEASLVIEDLTATRWQDDHLEIAEAGLLRGR